MTTTIIFVLIYISLGISIYLDIKKDKSVEFDLLAVMIAMLFNYNIVTTNQIKDYIEKHPIEYAITDITDSTATYKINGEYKTIEIEKDSITSYFPLN